MARGSELAEPAACGAKRVGLLNRRSAWFVSAPEVTKRLIQLIHNPGIDRLFNCWANHKVARVESDLPGVKWRDQDIPTDKLTPMHVIAKSRPQETNAIYRLVEPDGDAARVYEELYGLFRELYFGFGKSDAAPIAAGRVLSSLRRTAATRGNP